VVRPGPHPGAGYETIRGERLPPGPYVAETYPVEVEQAYVVVHV
jgi:hypothetical protein